MTTKEQIRNYHYGIIIGIKEQLLTTKSKRKIKALMTKMNMHQRMHRHYMRACQSQQQLQTATTRRPYASDVAFI